MMRRSSRSKQAEHNAEGEAGILAQRSSHEATAMMRSLARLESDILQYAKGRITPALTPIVDNISSILRDQMEVKVMDAHRADQKRLDEFGRNITDECGLDVVLLNNLTGKFNNAKRVHRECRTKQMNFSGTKEVCDNRTVQTHDQMKVACNETRKPNSSVCHPVEDEDLDEWAGRLAGHFGNLAADVEETQAKCKNWTDTYNRTVMECRNVTIRWTEIVVECTTYINFMNEFACQRAIEARSLCKAHGDCFDVKTGEYHELADRLDKQADDRKLEWKLIKRIDCLLDGFANGTNDTVDATKLTTCKDEVVNTSHLDLQYEVPISGFCSFASYYPCTEAYLNDTYRKIPAQIRPTCDFVCNLTAPAPTATLAPMPAPTMSNGSWQNDIEFGNVSANASQIGAMSSL